MIASGIIIIRAFLPLRNPPRKNISQTRECLPCLNSVLSSQEAGGFSVTWLTCT